MEERKASSSGTEEIRVGVTAEVVMLSGWQYQENEGSVSATHEYAKRLVRASQYYTRIPYIMTGATATRLK